MPHADHPHRIWTFVAALAALFTLIVWASDRVTLDGERTVYTVACTNGTWAATHCSGTLVDAERFKFRALKAHAEVLFWIAGSAQASGKFSECVIQDGRNWSCQPNAESSRSIAQRMTHGNPLAGGDGMNRAFHSVPKWKWHLIRMQLWPLRDADN